MSDIHWGAEACAEKDFIKTLQKHGGKPNTFFIETGDGFNFIPSTDKRFTVKMSAPAYRDFDDAIDWMVEDYLKPVREYTTPDQWLGRGKGNHERDYTKKCMCDPHKRLCREMGTHDLGYSFFYNLNFTQKGGAGRTVTIYGHHGWGGAARTEGANITKYAKNVTYYDADIFLYGHTHDKGVKRIIRILPTRRGELKVIAKPIIISNGGTYLWTLSQDEDPTYSEEKGLPPKDIGYNTIFLQPDNKKAFVDLRAMV